MITFVIGGARSGKSGFALKSASDIAGRKAYIATAQALDDEMKLRIERHKQERSPEWETYEEPLGVSKLLGLLDKKYSVIVVDCLTIWLSNVIMANADIEAEIESLLFSARSCEAKLFMISNEVGMGIVPENRLAREFRDHSGIMNRRIAEISDSVYMLAAGIPLKLK